MKQLFTHQSFIKYKSMFWLSPFLLLISFFVVISCADDVVEVGDPTDTMTDSRDGNSYKTVTIGDQVWMAENLAYTGSIRHVIEEDDWADLSYTDQAYCYYDNDSSFGYGVLYTWAAAMGGSGSSDSNPSGIQGVCPSGWHLPSDAEWTELEDYLIANGYNYDGSTSDNKIAKSMASKTGWSSSISTGDVGNSSSTNNSSGFSGLPGGYRNSNGTFNLVTLDLEGSFGRWRSSTQYDSYRSYYRNLYYCNQFLYCAYDDKAKGLSVRCIRN